MKRAFVALPFVVTFLLAYKVMEVTAVIPLMAPIIRNGTVSWNTGSASLRTNFYNMKTLDDM
jgi:hypothetical protein